MGPRAGLDRCGKSRPPPGFFLMPRVLYSDTTDVKAYIILIHQCHCGFINTARLLENIILLTPDFWPDTV